MRAGRRVVLILPCKVKLRTFIEQQFAKHASVNLITDYF
jgi:hypothetical protein